MKQTIGVVGATGMVGQKAIQLLKKWEHLIHIKAFASSQSPGRQVENIPVESTTAQGLEKCQALIFATEAPISKQWIPHCLDKNILCVDKSSAYRELAPLVVPEVNGHILTAKLLKERPLVANPNCCATPLVMLLKPLKDHYGIERVIVSTYQSVSGAGQKGVDTLRQQMAMHSAEHTPENNRSPMTQKIDKQHWGAFPAPIAFNVMPFVASIDDSGNTDEENKIISETRSILELPNLKISATSVRVPTFVSHALSVTVQLQQKTQTQNIYNTLKNFPGIMAQSSDFATPLDGEGKNQVFVGRIREAHSFENGFSFWIVSDNLLKGAAFNAVQIVNQCLGNLFP